MTTARNVFDAAKARAYAQRDQHPARRRIRGGGTSIYLFNPYEANMRVKKATPRPPLGPNDSQATTPALLTPTPLVHYKPGEKIGDANGAATVAIEAQARGFREIAYLKLTGVHRRDPVAFADQVEAIVNETTVTGA